MFQYIKKIFSSPQADPEKQTGKVERVDEGSVIYGSGAAKFDLAQNMNYEEGLPVLDWNALNEWLLTIDPASQGKAWSDAELAWLSCMRSALGETYQVSRFEQSVVLSSLNSSEQELVLGFMASSLKKIVRTLGSVASVPEWGYDILIVFDDEDTYYRYVSRYYPEDGEFSFSSGMHISNGCGHFVTTKQEMNLIEPVIVHEMTHSCLAHLPIPAWLNEGLAVNAEHSLCNSASRDTDSQKLHERHLNFWTPTTVQQLWSGASFKRTDEGCELSYDISRILVSQLAKNWAQFESFVLEAEMNDGGQMSASDKYGLTLGAMICALLEKEHSSSWEPMPEMWNDAPERGGFRVAAQPFAAGRRP